MLGEPLLLVRTRAALIIHYEPTPDARWMEIQFLLHLMKSQILPLSTTHTATYASPYHLLSMFGAWKLLAANKRGSWFIVHGSKFCEGREQRHGAGQSKQNSLSELLQYILVVGVFRLSWRGDSTQLFRAPRSLARTEQVECSSLI